MAAKKFVYVTVCSMLLEGFVLDFLLDEAHFHQFVARRGLFSLHRLYPHPRVVLPNRVVHGKDVSAGTLAMMLCTCWKTNPPPGASTSH